MSFLWFGSAETGDNINVLGVVGGISSAASEVVTTPTLVGARAFQGNPQSGPRYGWTAGLNNETHILISFMFRFAAVLDETVIISELGKREADQVVVRALALDTNRKIRLFDDEGDTVAQTSAGYLSVNTNYRILIYYNFNDPINTIDKVWVHNGSSWDLAIDVKGHGDVDASNIAAVSFGSTVGKTQATSGGPLFWDDVAVQDLGTAPNTVPLGSTKSVYRVPTANGTDGDFNTGTGTNPNYQDVDEIPEDDDTSTDIGDVAGDQQSYEITDAVTNDVPLAVQVYGVGKKSASGGTLNIKSYIHDGTTRDYGAGFNYGIFQNYRGINAYYETRAYNKINGAILTELLFNNLEAGVEITAAAGRTLILTQIGLEYLLEGPVALPDDFPYIVGGAISVNQSINRAGTY